MQLALVATKVDSGYQLHIRDVRFYSTRQPATSMEPPRYPVDAARAGVMGNVLLAVRINAQGQVVDAMATQVAFPYRDMKPKQSAQWAKAFGKASIEAARKWQFTPANVEFGDVADATLILPVTFWWASPSPPSTGGRNFRPSSARRFLGLPRLSSPSIRWVCAMDSRWRCNLRCTC